MTTTSNNLASESWAIADLLRGDFKQSQYGRIILPFCLLRREMITIIKRSALLKLRIVTHVVRKLRRFIPVDLISRSPEALVI